LSGCGASVIEHNPPASTGRTYAETAADETDGAVENTTTVDRLAAANMVDVAVITVEAGPAQ